MTDQTHRLQATADAAWERYRSCCGLGGTKEERRFAYDQASKAEDALAAHDRATQPARDREAAARALSGA